MKYDQEIILTEINKRIEQNLGDNSELSALENLKEWFLEQRDRRQQISDIYSFLNFIETNERDFIPRSELIDLICTIKEDWSYILRAFLICSNERLIDLYYLKEKVQFMINKPSEQQHEFMDIWRKNIYLELKKALNR